MMNSVYKKINSFANSRSTAVLFFITFLLMFLINKVNMPVSVARINEISKGIGILDMRLFYTSNDAHILLEKLQPIGRLVYMELLLIYDMVFPLIYSMSMSFLIAITFRNAFPYSTSIRKLCLIPFVVGLCDWMENICILVMLFEYPRFAITANIAGYFTSCKWIFSWISLALCLVGISFAIRQSIKKNERK